MTPSRPCAGERCDPDWKMACARYIRQGGTTERPMYPDFVGEHCGYFVKYHPQQEVNHDVLIHN